MTSIAIIGGTGYTGSNIAREALSRGIEVTSVSRHEPAEPIEGVQYLTGDIADQALLERVAADHDVVVIAIHAVDGDNAPVLLPLTPAIAGAAKQGGARLGVVGGAGSSFVAEGGPRLLDTAEFLDAWKPEASSHAEVLQWLQANGGDLEWFYVSPAALYGSFAPGETTGEYRTNGDVLVTKEDGSSEISGTDFALAFVDEIVEPKHTGRRFTVGH
ncbi:NAD-dependent epimerase [Cnuibacter physcomitrellae]|uniref:NAD(P)-dependent oxidoreductase n=1 Tax=Cnuibacter physcomitrellae TaxID=1619308 RepID=UPI0019B9132D|nr:NAD(P)H-binding protein [Cnuibacter physcomitrellae]GGI42267.1 NAD-dependent epimerase [Cnuibacter physcomitrellae]